MFIGLDTPFVTINEQKLDTNISDMADFAQKSGVKLRPHIKAHKTKEIALKQLKAGACGVTVAKLGEAEIMAEIGVKDIFIAYQLIGEAKIYRLVKLMNQADVTVAVDSIEGIKYLAKGARQLGREIPVMVEINSGLNRCGVLPGGEALELAKRVLKTPGLKLKGIFTHAGQAYGSSSNKEVLEIGKHEGIVMAETANLLRSAGISLAVVSVGSTPTVKASGRVEGITEIRPGNYVFYDAIQVGLGVVPVERCSLSIITTVISRPAAGRVIVDAGSKVFALDKGAHGTEVVKGFGFIKGYPKLALTRLSEEHGIIETEKGNKELPEVGARLEIIPNHACTVVNLTNCLKVANEGKIFANWSVAARGRVD